MNNKGDFLSFDGAACSYQYQTMGAGVLFDYVPLEFIRAPGPITIK
jgi:hypothetical protein